MRSGQALAQHLQVLQSGRSLDAPWHDTPVGAVGLLQLPSEELFKGVEAADLKRLQEVVKTAEFWIALLEGERTDLSEEVVKHKQRYQLALRQADTQAKALRIAEQEKTRLEKDLKWLQDSRDQAIGDRALARADAKKLEQNQSLSTRTAQDFEDAAAKMRTLEDELHEEQEAKASLEENLVRTKIKHCEALQRADSMEVLIKFYEDQLAAANPHFQRQDLNALGQWMPNKRSQNDSADEVESNASEVEEQAGKKKGVAAVKEGFSKMRGFFRKAKASKNELPAPEDGAEVTPRNSAVEDSPSAGDEEDSTPAAPAGAKPRWMMRSES